MRSLYMIPHFDIVKKGENKKLENCILGTLSCYALKSNGCVERKYFQDMFASSTKFGLTSDGIFYPPSDDNFSRYLIHYVKIIDGNMVTSHSHNICNCNEIIDVNVIVPNKVVEVTFADGDKQKSVCKDDDTFSLEQGITICLAKHIMGCSTYGSTIYKAVRGYNKKIKAIKEEEEKRKEAERIATNKKAKKQAYIERCRQKDKERLERERKEKIAIQKEAYIQAMEYMKNKDIKDVKDY